MRSPNDSRMSEFGLPPKALATVREILARHPEVDEAILYGSRATGRHRAGSDIDLTLVGSALTPRHLAHIAGELDDSSSPYTVDLSLRALIEEPALRAHIDAAGLVLYRRTD